MANESGFYIDSGIVRDILSDLVKEGVVSAEVGELIKLKLLIEQRYVSIP